VSYVQGSAIRITATFADPDSGAATDPAVVTMTIRRPDATSELRSYPATISKLSTGVYRTTIDTSAQAGSWRYEIGSTGTGAIRAQRTLRVVAALPTA